MARPNALKWPTLAKAWLDYGHSIPWGDLFDMKVGGHGYVALAWMEDEEVNYADLSKVGDTWEMQHDGHDPMPLSRWKKARVKPECDWLVFPDDE